MKRSCAPQNGLASFRIQPPGTHATRTGSQTMHKDQLAITLVQTELVWENPEANRDHMTRRLSDLPETDLVVLPEMWSTGFSMASERLAEPMAGSTIAWMKAMAGNLEVPIAGSVIIEDQGRHFNRFCLALPNGDIQHYDKRHLFRMAGEHKHYAAGHSRPVFELHGYRLLPQVCYDLRFPVFMRNRNHHRSVDHEESYDLMLVVANWPARRRHHWRTLLQARAIENQCYVVGVNRIGIDGNDVEYCGDSIVADFEGMLLADLREEDAVHRVVINREDLVNYRNGFPAWKDADEFDLTIEGDPD